MEGWDELERDVDRWLADARSRVVEWRWFAGSAELEAPVPLWVERDGREPVTRPLERSPKEPADAVQYGYDAHGRLVVAIRGDGGPPSEITAWGHLSDGAEAQLHFTGAAGRLSLGRVAVPEYEQGKLSRMTLTYDPRAVGGEQVEEYTYDDEGRLVRIDVTRTGAGTDDYEICYEARLDHRGDLALLVAHDEDGSRVVCRRSDSKECKAAKRLFERRMVELVPQWASRVGESRSPYCLALIYSFDEPRVPPMLGLGLAEDSIPRRPSRADLEPDALTLVDPDPVEFEEPDFQEACRTLSQEWRSREDDAEPRRTLVAIAKRLVKLDWSPTADGIGPFVVFAVDDEGADLDRNLRAAGFRQG